MLWGILTAYGTGISLVWGQTKEFLQSEEFLLSFASLVLVSTSIAVGWWVKSISAGHREAKLRRLFGDWEMTKVARRRRQEDAIYEAISGLVYQKVVSSREAKRIFRVLANNAGLEGLCIPPNEYKKLHAYQMARLKAKTAAGIAALKASGPVPLPKEEPRVTKPSIVRNFVTRVRTRNAAA